MFQKGNKINLGRKHSRTTKDKISATQRIRLKDRDTIIVQATGRKISKAQLGEKNHNWKGGISRLGSVHKWVVRCKGKASDYKCEHCDKQADHWSNKKHNYRYALDDYVALCSRCHKEWDKENNSTN